MNRQTIALHTPYIRPDAYGALAVPIYSNVAYEFADAQTMADVFCERQKAPDYSRVANPTVTQFEQRVRALSGAEHVTAFVSGMAAISNVLLALVKSGKNVVASRRLFGNTFSLINVSLARLGIEVRLRNLTNINEVAAAVDENTACIFLEIITNPQLEVADLSALAQVAHSKNVPLVVDSTLIPFTETQLSRLGVDIEVLSSTKYLSGGGTSLGGLVIDYGKFPDFNKTLKHEMLFNFGAYQPAQSAYMQTLGLETLAVRYKQQAANALALAQALQHIEQIIRVDYVGLPTHKYHQIAQQQFGPTAGAMLTIDLHSEAECFLFLNNLKLIHRATNMFDNRTLAIHPYSTIFGLFSKEEKEKMDVRNTTIRISVGLEDVNDLLNDIKQALS